MTMHRAQIQITLKSATSFSLRSATQGGHQTLLHVPGAALLGAMAAEIPNGLDRWTIVHSGKVRFGDGLPSRNGRVAWPAPASLMRRKANSSGLWPPLNTASFKEDDIAELHNAAHSPPAEGQQWNPAKLQYVLLPEDGSTDAFLHVRPRTVDRLKTAIDPVRGTSREQMLFEIEALASNQVFQAAIEARLGTFSSEPAKDRQAFDAMVNAFAPASGRVVRLGRSRATEFGSAELRLLPGAERNEHQELISGEVVVWVLSDTVIIGSAGIPASELTAAAFGLTGGTLIASRSFVGMNSVTPFNGFRGTNDVERQSIKAGSVLVFSGVTHAVRGQSRVGAYQAAGCGHIWVAPPILSSTRIEIILREEQIQRKPVDATLPQNNPLMAWMLSTAGRSQQFSSERIRGGSASAQSRKSI
ncbi:hypothetical protein [Rhabdaerophilum sp. SD176]|uniref:hypothetical protein n=1 Tax=Rhabdaerophilum sp. SD176 TaxID=2983548 RepID=UPI0024E022BA|nr:hypothetical protein [Rhabdaerophilum sp. SD176]